MFSKLQVYPAEQDCASPAGQLPNVMQFEKHPDVVPFFGLIAPGSSSVLRVERHETRAEDGGPGVPELLIKRTPAGHMMNSRVLYYKCDTTCGYCVALVLFYRYFVNGRRIASEASDTFIFWTADRDSIRGYIRKFVGRTSTPHYLKDISAHWTVFDLETKSICKVDAMSVPVSGLKRK